MSAEEGSQSLIGFLSITVVWDIQRSLVCCDILEIKISFLGRLNDVSALSMDFRLMEKSAVN